MIIQLPSLSIATHLKSKSVIAVSDEKFENVTLAPLLHRGDEFTYSIPIQYNSSKY